MADPVQPTRILVVGAGLVGARHVTQVMEHPGCILAGVVDPEPSRHPPDVPCFTDVTSVTVPVDGVIIATPTATHGEIGAEAAARRWPMLVEKPIAADVAAGEALIAACARAGVPLLVGHHRRHHPFIGAAREMLAAGRLGRVVGVSGLWCVRKPDPYFSTAWRTGAGGSPVLINLVHDLDLLRCLMGAIVGITASFARGEGRATEDTGVVTLTFANGALGSFLFSDAAPSPWSFEAATAENPTIAGGGRDVYRIIGTEGALSLPSLTVFEGTDWSHPVVARSTVLEPVDPLRCQLDHFIEVIAGRTQPICSGADGLAALSTALEIRAAGRAGWEDAA
ncbi:MAG: Gfo/Idh/MocA family oxidoreductase [Pseudomonadota bacterium]